MEKNIEKLLNESSEFIGGYHKNMFYWDTKHEFEDLRVESPIEQLLYTALKATVVLTGGDPAEPVEIQGKEYMIGTGIYPQEKIGKYRVDFLIIEYDRGKGKTQIRKSVIVECDSQEWHERTESERRYEKARDRYLQNIGYKVFHFTGKEIIEDAFKVATEILRLLSECEAEIIG